MKEPACKKNRFNNFANKLETDRVWAIKLDTGLLPGLMVSRGCEGQRSHTSFEEVEFQ